MHYCSKLTFVWVGVWGVKIIKLWLNLTKHTLHTHAFGKKSIGFFIRLNLIIIVVRLVNDTHGTGWLLPLGSHYVWVPLQVSRFTSGFDRPFRNRQVLFSAFSFLFWLKGLHFLYQYFDPRSPCWSSTIKVPEMFSYQ